MFPKGRDVEIQGEFESDDGEHADGHAGKAEDNDAIFEGEGGTGGKRSASERKASAGSVPKKKQKTTNSKKDRN